MIKMFLLLFPLLSFAKMQGALLFNGNCATCHHTDKARSAPTVFEIRKQYLNAFRDKKTFVEYMTKWVLQPNRATSLMEDKIEATTK